jgi:plastocyanin
LKKAGTGARLAAVTFAALTLATGFAACGDDDESTTDTSATETTATTEASGDAENVTVTATEYDFELSATPTADTKTVTFDNQGEEFHVMIFARINEGFTTAEAVELQGKKGSADVVAETEAQPGKSSEVDVKQPLEPGDYALLCPIGGPDGLHYELGQLEEFPID